MSKLILFVADERELHEAIALWLSERAMIVRAPIEMHMALSEQQFSVVIVDAWYAEVSGYALAEDIKRIYEPAPKVVLISNERAIGRAEKARYAGADALLATPFFPPDLEAHL